MNPLERSQNLLKILKKRDQTPEMVERIARVEKEIAEMKTPPITPKPEPAPAPKPEPKREKRKKVKTIEVEVDDDEEDDE